MTRIGIYGGTFSPPHNGHIAAAKAFMEQMWLDILYVIPAATPPHKQMTCAVSPEDRLNMCRLAFSEMEGVYVSDMEIRRGGKSYTYDTLKELQRPDTRLFLLCGTDMVLTFDQWYRFEDIFKMCYPAYVRRENDPILTTKVVAKVQDYYQKYGVMFRRIVTEPTVLSSTEIRRAVRDGKDIGALVPPAVADFIRQNGLYLEEDKKEET